ncbi:hypothetical protein BDK51DRAFT_50117 [Blyttiomyces helicus]|uniref:Uncharacterized protein n=1 Tax=Blyttiomyces helicus TaxID=388810 RepID=A0A4P9W6T3_9FUNG|nr:hypothetical protein BDK51DRAFT_50117 [Blyttiomyces helicus]|eukprot:RKO88179.1 hypothetical protein BDK51DRAFT_50117 [Blyttiomyces helicus]
MSMHATRADSIIQFLREFALVLGFYSSKPQRVCGSVFSSRLGPPIREWVVTGSEDAFSLAPGAAQNLEHLTFHGWHPDVQYPPIQSDFFARLSPHAPSLRTAQFLTVSMTTNADIIALLHYFPAIEELDLAQHLQLTDAALLPLHTHRPLRALDICDTRFSSSAVVALLTARGSLLESLRWRNLMAHTRHLDHTHAVVDQLVASFPSLRFIFPLPDEDEGALPKGIHEFPANDDQIPGYNRAIISGMSTLRLAGIPRRKPDVNVEGGWAVGTGQTGNSAARGASHRRTNDDAALSISVVSVLASCRKSLENRGGGCWWKILWTADKDTMELWPYCQEEKEKRTRSGLFAHPASHTFAQGASWDAQMIGKPVGGLEGGRKPGSPLPPSSTSSPNPLMSTSLLTQRAGASLVAGADSLFFLAGNQVFDGVGGNGTAFTPVDVPNYVTVRYSDQLTDNHPVPTPPNPPFWSSNVACDTNAGTIYCYGDQNSTALLSFSPSLSPLQFQSIPLPPPAPALTGASFTIIQGAGYIFGGLDPLTLARNTLWKVDLAGASSSIQRVVTREGVAPPPAGEGACVARVGGDGLLVYGGSGGDGVTYLYNVTASNWTSIPAPPHSPSPSGRNQPSCTTLNGDAYLFGGYAYTSHQGLKLPYFVDANMWRFSARQKTWSALTNVPALPPGAVDFTGVPAARSGASLAAVGRFLVLSGGDLRGMDLTTDTRLGDPSFYFFDTETSIWSKSTAGVDLLTGASSPPPIPSTAPTASTAFTTTATSATTTLSTTLATTTATVTPTPPPPLQSPPPLQTGTASSEASLPTTAPGDTGTSTNWAAIGGGVAAAVVAVALTAT